MKKNLKKILYFFPVFFLALYFLSPSGDEQEIRKSLREIASLLEISGPEHPFLHIKIAKQLSGYAVNDLRVEFQAKDGEREPIVLKNQRELEQKIILARSQLKFLKIILQGADVKVRGNVATAKLTVNAYGKFASEDGDFLDRHIIELELVKDKGDWRIAVGRHLENLRGEGKM